MNRARRLWLAALLAAAGSPWAQTTGTAPTELAAVLPAARLQGRARLRFLGLSVYEARLWLGAMPVAADWAAVPFAIEIEYARSLSGSLMADRSLAEMRRQGEMAPDVAERWLTTMRALFPDVRDGDRLVGVHTPGQGARFFLNGSPRVTTLDEAFSRVFFGIWLSPRTSEPAMRTALLGPAP